MDCERCHEVTRDFVVRNGFHMVFLKLLSIPREPESEPWDADSFLFYMRNERAIHEEELRRAREDGDGEGELREAGYLQALDFVIEALLDE